MAVPIINQLDQGSKNRTKVVEEIVKLEKKLFPKHESLAKSFDEELKKRNCGLLYSEVAGEVAGYIMYSWPSSLFASITKLAVRENYRRQGHGEALMKAAIEKCRTRKIQRVTLHVDPSRTAALALYRKLGFEIDKLIEVQIFCAQEICAQRISVRYKYRKVNCIKRECNQSIYFVPLNWCKAPK